MTHLNRLNPERNGRSLNRSAWFSGEKMRSWFQLNRALFKRFNAFLLKRKLIRVYKLN